VEFIMILLGALSVAAGIGLAAASLRSPRHRALLELAGGGLFLVGLGLAGANLALAS
jgi:hypothetical protein